MKNITVRKLIKALEKDGFILKMQDGSHRTYKHSDGRWVVVPFHHSGKVLPSGTLNSIIKDLNWTNDDLIRPRLTRKG